MAPSRVPLCALPTPLHRLQRASQDLGIDLWTKRDDLTGFAGGGNKGRKLEFLIAQALDEQAEVIVSSGSSQSNFLRQLACACSMFGIRCVAATMDLPYDKAAGKPAGDPHPTGGNRVLDELFGLEMRVFPDDDWEVLFAHVDAIADELRKTGLRASIFPTGGSTPLGAYGFFMAGKELEAQAREPFDWIVVPTSSCSTHAGVAYCFHGKPTRVIGISCDPEPELTADLWRLAAGLDTITGADKLMVREDFNLRLGYVGPGYGVSSPAGEEAFEYMWRQEGILLDPVYSAKTFAGLLDLVLKSEISGRVLFWHTGGLPTLFAG
jgi:1-aminocyclopropane-1-carboxylate deaminase/D-cysteine desulfhydrase-like pyridoxal-dependent ACC family enzyme